MDNIERSPLKQDLSEQYEIDLYTAISILVTEYAAS